MSEPAAASTLDQLRELAELIPSRDADLAELRAHRNALIVRSVTQEYRTIEATAAAAGVGNTHVRRVIERAGA